MANLGVIFLCLALGITLRRSRIFPENAATTLNRFVIYISLPALTLLYLHKLPLNVGTLYPVLMAWILFVVGAILLGVLGKVRGWSAPATGALILTAAMGNTSFLGFPLLQAFYGPSALSVGILNDQPGSFLVLGTLGIAVASFYSGGRTSAAAVFSRILKFPPFLSVLVALALRPLRFPEAWSEILRHLGDTLIPMALVSVGAQLDWNWEKIRLEISRISVGLFYKLILGPALMAVLYIGILGARGRMIQITILEAAMAPMITASIVAAEYGLDAELGNLMIAVGIPISLLTVPLWWFLLEHVASG